MNLFLRLSIRTACAGIVFCAAALPTIAIAESTPAVQSDSKRTELLGGLADRVRRVVLDNGLRILLVKRATAPVFAGQVWVKVGGVNEVPGKTGAAHLLEHMAFKGTDKIGTKDYEKEKSLLARLEAIMHKDGGEPAGEDVEELKKIYADLKEVWVDNEFSRIYQRRGGVGLNAGTAKDYTMYQVELPSIALELWCWMESERLLNPVFRQFYKEKEVVREERRTRTDDSPSGIMYEALLATAYWNHPYRLPVIGWSSDLHGLTAEDTAKLHRAYYRPDNIVLVLVGDLDADAAVPMLTKYFGRIPKAKEPLPALTAVEEEQSGPREATVEFDAEPSVVMGYHKPTYPNPDDMYFSLLHTMLSAGRSSIFYKDFVIKRQLAVGVDTSEAPGSLYPSLFYVAATPRQGVPTEKLRDEVQKLLDELATKGFAADDFEAARKRVKVSFLSSLDSNDDLAETLAQSELLWGDWHEVLKMFELVNTATEADVRKLIGKYLTVKNRTVVTLVRPAKSASDKASHVKPAPQKSTGQKTAEAK